jgi:hypothetical protein
MANIIDIILKATDESSKTIKDATGQQADAFKTLTGISLSTAGAIGVVTAATKLAVDGMKFAVDQAKESETAQVRLAAVYKATGGAVGLSVNALNDMSESLSNVSSIDDEVISGAEAILLTFRNIGEEAFPQAMQAALDMGAVMGTDLNSAVTMLGKALNDPIAGLTALTRVGVSFTASQKSTIKSLVETGDTAAAQNIILKEMNQEFGGAAQANAYSYAGSLDAIKISEGNLGAAIGEGALPALTIQNALIKDGIDSLVNYVTMQNLGNRAANGDVIAQQELNQAVMDAQKGIKTATPSWGAYTDAMIANGRAQTDAKRAAAGFIPLYNTQSDAVKAATVDMGDFTNVIVGATPPVDTLANKSDELSGSLHSVSANAGDAYKNINKLSEIDPNYLSKIGSAVEGMKWQGVGGPEIEAMGEKIIKARENLKMTGGEAQQALRDLAGVNARALIEQGMSAKDATKQVADALKISMRDAKTIVQDTGTTLQSIEGEYFAYLTVVIRTVGSLPPGVTGGSQAGGNPSGGFLTTEDEEFGHHGGGKKNHASGGDFVVPPGYPNDSFMVGVSSGEHFGTIPANPSASSFPGESKPSVHLNNYGKIEFVVKNGATLSSIMQEMSQL